MHEVAADTRLQINDDEIAAEIIDSEAVLINLGTGMYYTLDGTGCEMWAMVERRLSLAEMSDALAARYRIEFGVVLRDLQRLAAELLDERLVRLAREPDAASHSDASAADSARSPAAYAPPTLCRYTDMSEVLALDPPLPVLKSEP